ncbi:hypothetical protein Hanom_Chr15g01381311 [Helianthus anomalus]
MALPLVFMLPNSTCLPFPGSWNRSPGCRSTKSTTPMSTGPQSAIFILFLHKTTSLKEGRGEKLVERERETVWGWGL